MPDDVVAELDRAIDGSEWGEREPIIPLLQRARDEIAAWRAGHSQRLTEAVQNASRIRAEALEEAAALVERYSSDPLTEPAMQMAAADIRALKEEP